VNHGTLQSSQRSVSRGPGLRHPNYALSQAELRAQSLRRLYNAAVANMHWSVRRTVYAVQFRAGKERASGRKLDVLAAFPPLWVSATLAHYQCHRVLIKHATALVVRELRSL